MKRVLSVLFAIILLTSLVQAQTVPTPNIGLQIPAGGSQNWNVPLNYNFNLLDQIIGATLLVPGNGLQLKPEFGSGAPATPCSTLTNEGQQYFDSSSIPFQSYTCHNNAWTSNGGGGGGVIFPVGLLFATDPTTLRTAVPSDIASLLSTLTNCTTPNFVYSPANGFCVPSSTSIGGLTPGFLILGTSSTNIGSSATLDDGHTTAGTFTVNENQKITGNLTVGTIKVTPNLTLSGTSKTLSLTDPLSGGDTTLQLDNLFLNANQVIGGSTVIGNLTMQQTIVAPSNSLGSSTLILGNTNGVNSTVNQIYAQFSSTSISFPTALTSAGCLTTSSAGVVTSTGLPCGTGGGGSAAFNAITSGTNTVATMIVSSGANLHATGSGVIAATTMDYSGLTGVVPTWDQDTTGNAQTATTLQGTPSVCSAGQVPSGVDSSGNALGCFNPSGSVSGTIGRYGIFSGSTSMGNGTIDYGITTAATNTSSVPFQINDGSGTGGTFTSLEGSSPAGLAGKARIYDSNATHQFMVNQNAAGEAYLMSIVTPGTPGDCMVFGTNGVQPVDSGSTNCNPGSSSTPTFVVDAGAGTGATVSLLSGANDNRGWINIVVGTTPAASSGIITVKYGGTYSTVRKCSVAPASATAQGLASSAQPFVPSGSSALNLFVMQGGATTLAAGQNYTFLYECGL